MPVLPASPRRRRRANALPEEVRRQLGDVPRGPLERPLLLLAIAGVVIAFAWVAASWPRLPATLPTHFAADGRPDGWGARATLWLLPGLALLVFGVLTLAARASPAGYNYPFRLTAANARRQASLARELLAWLRAAIVWVFALVAIGTTAAARREGGGLGAWFLPLTLALVWGPVLAYFARAARAR